MLWEVFVAVAVVLLTAAASVAWRVYRVLHGSGGSSEQQLTEEQMLTRFIAELRRTPPADLSVLPYDPAAASSLARFQPIRRGTQCAFAATSRLWGSQWREGLTLEENARLEVPVLAAFVPTAKSQGLDGFAFEIGEPYAGRIRDAKGFGQLVRRVLRVFSDGDPAGERCMDRSYLGKRGWVFHFLKEPFFLTTFAPCYGEANPRYGFGSGSAWVLFQPEFSFAVHRLDADTPHTDWEAPRTIRDRIRVAFRDHGRPYHIPATVVYPPAHKIVQPMAMGDPVVTWWVPDPEADLPPFPPPHPSPAQPSPAQHTTHTTPLPGVATRSS